MARKKKKSARNKLRKPADGLPPIHPVKQYADAVMSGEIVAGRLVRLACKRHLDDLEPTQRRGFYFDPELATHALDFFPDFLRLDGDENKPFILQPWETFIVGSLFGWMGRGKLRRFRTAYIEAGKGSGKTPLAAGIGLYGLICDQEWAAEIYCAAVTKDQSYTLFRDAKRMAEANPDLAAKLEIGEHNIAYPSTLSFLRPVSSEARSLDAKRVQMALVDEIHEHRSSIVVGKMDLGKKGRRQPLMVEITNAGYDRHSVCWQHHEYTRSILEGMELNDLWFGYVCQLDPCSGCQKSGRIFPDDKCKKCDDWRDERTWIKTNPNLGISLRPEYLREKVREAIGMPAKQNIVKRLNFCIWTEQQSRWLDLDLWDGGSDPIDLESLFGRPCFAGLDLSSNKDLTARALVFPADDAVGRWIVLLRFWIPEENVKARVERDLVPYDVWIREGYIETTPGNVVDKDFIEAAILEDATRYKILQVAYDRLFADQLVQHLENERPGYIPEVLIDPLTGRKQTQWCVPIGMGFYSMAAPCKEFERLVQGKLLHHGGHPVLRWNAGNVTVQFDPAGNMKPTKADDKKRIDGIVAILMALARAMVQPHEDTGKSVYDERPPLTL